MKIFSYLNDTKSFEITYVRGSGLGLEVYEDVDYANKANDRRSVFGIAVTLGGTVLSHANTTGMSCRCRPQRQSASQLGTGSRTLFVRAVLFFNAPETSGTSIKVFEDNQGVKALIENPLSSARSKHIVMRFHFVRDLFRTRKISVEHIASAEQHADILTKALSKTNFQYHRKLLVIFSESGYFSTRQVVSSSKCTSTSPEAG